MRVLKESWQLWIALVLPTVDERENILNSAAKKTTHSTANKPRFG
jgi:hypothetical protein